MNIEINELALTLNADRVTTLNGGVLVSGTRLGVGLGVKPRSFYRHGWQSWTLSTWMDPTDPMVPISAHQTRAKDEDVPYAFSDHPVSAWVGAAEMPDGRIVLLGALELSGRVEMLGEQLQGFYEDGHAGKWLVAAGTEEEVFKAYTQQLGALYGLAQGKPPRVWCSWYSLYNTINEAVIDQALDGLGDLPFDVFQLDDGWQVSLGEWDANRKFPSGMPALAEKVRRTGRTAGLWLAPFIVPRRSKLALEHEDWILKDEAGMPVYAGVSWSGALYALDSAHPGVQEWLDATIRRVVGWGYDYLKLDFLYAAAAPGRHARGMPRESAYREAMQVIRTAAGRDTYILACGAPILPVLGLCNGIRIGPDVTPFWENRALSVWLNNPNHPGVRNALRTCLHRLWLKDLIHIDPDVAYFRSRHNHLTPGQARMLHDLVRLTSFRATSDLPRWWRGGEREAVRRFLEEENAITQTGRYQFSIDGRAVDFSPVMPLPEAVRFPAQAAMLIGMLQMGWQELLPGLLASRAAKLRRR